MWKCRSLRATATSPSVYKLHIVSGWHSNRRPGSSPLSRSIGRRHRRILALRAVDGWLEGNSYRNIAEGLFCETRIPDRHDLHSRTIRLVKMWLRLMRAAIVSCSVTRAKTSARNHERSPTSRVHMDSVESKLKQALDINSGSDRKAWTDS
ncbi:DNA -binding domain-containing protein [Bradyrhizobium sp. CCBAU 51765]|uniref:DNA -binding domain-containing protein n=1 Tax=Bradyrhizobium sp. CCBAU 51765 TaxID=1325102 RepID=UPI001FEDEF62|nr:DUF2285 domain-containing protein [Bradyrhizobium sp. CCBAU 51765]